MDLIEKLQFLMKKNNIKNISQLAKETNIPYTTLKSIFDGDVNDIRLSTSRKLSEYFKITLDELLDNNIILDNQNFRFASYNGFNSDELDDTDIEEINRFVEFIKNKKKNEEKKNGK